MFFQKPITLHTPKHGAMHDLTQEVAAIVVDSAIQMGVVHVFAVGSTAALGTIEFEPGLQKDLPDLRDQGSGPANRQASRADVEGVGAAD